MKVICPNAGQPYCYDIYRGVMCSHAELHEPILLGDGRRRCHEWPGVCFGAWEEVQCVIKEDDKHV